MGSKRFLPKEMGDVFYFFSSDYTFIQFFIDLNKRLKNRLELRRNSPPNARRVHRRSMGLFTPRIVCLASNPGRHNSRSIIGRLGGGEVVCDDASHYCPFIGQ